MEAARETAKEGNSTTEENEGPTDELIQTIDAVDLTHDMNKGKSAESKIPKKQVGMAKMESMFLAIEKLDPGSNLTDATHPSGIENQPTIHDVDATDSKPTKSTKTSLKPTTLNDPIDVDATILVPTDIDVLAYRDDEVAFIVPHQLKSVYGFSGVDEFLMKDNDARNARHAVRSAFDLQPKTAGYGEIDLYRCQHWYKDLRFASLIDKPGDGDHTWYFRLVVINPSAPDWKLVKNKHLHPRIAKFKELALKFYVSGFAPKSTTTSTIRVALENEITIMIVTKKKAGPIHTWKPMWEEKNQGMKVVAAVTFCRTFPSRKERHDVAAFISWLLVAKHDTLHPTQINGWRRQGFGLFLIIAMIKYCYANDNATKTLEIFLQSYEPSAFHFYTMLGFKQINDHFDDGFSMLPRHVRDHLSAFKCAEFKISIFHAYEKDDPNSVVYQLMHLRSRCLRHFQLAPADEAQAVSQDASDTNNAWKLWCEFPPPIVRGIRLHYSDSTMRQLFVGLPFVKALLPPPYASVPPLTTMFVKGEVRIERRLLHTEAHGVKWMQSGELDLMMAILLCDGRYQDLCFVMPCCYCDSIAIAFAKFVEYQRALKMVKLGKEQDLDPVKLAQAIMDRFKAPVTQLASDYCKLRNHLVQHVIHPNPGILDRRMIVFPCNENESHWSATFVFNAAYNTSEVEKRNKDGLRACFFRYCSMDTNGRRNVPISQGILWFLNLCSSYDAHEKKHSDPSEGKLEWLSPFGEALDGNMLGTPTFPALHLPLNSDILPKQSNNDTYNCAFGVIATLAMVLRDLIVDDASFDEQFSATALELKKCALKNEMYCDMPYKDLQPPWVLLPKIKRESFLPELREQWFVLFDRLAKLQFDVEPKKVFPDYLVPDVYTNNLPLISQWPVGNQDILLEAKAAASPSPKKDRAKTQRKLLPKAGLKTGIKIKTGTTIQSDSTASSAIHAQTEASKPTNDEAARVNINHSDEANVLTQSDHVATNDNNRIEEANVLLLTPEKGSENMDVPESAAGASMERAVLNADVQTEASANITQSQTLASDTKTFEPKPLVVPLKRKTDAVEDMAEAFLKKIRIKDPLDAKKLEKAIIPFPDPTPKFCTQSKALCEKLATEYGVTGLPTPTIMKRSDYEAEIEEYIEQSFKAWKWHTKAQHQAELDRWARKKNIKGISKETIRDIDMMIKALQDERTKFRKFFANEFKCTQKTLVQSVRFDKATNSFRAKLVWTEEVPVFPPQTNNQKQKTPQKASHYDYIRQEEEIDVEEEWVKSEFEPMFDQIINMRQDDSNWTQVPRDVEVFIGKKKIIRIRYCPEYKRSLVDTAALDKRIEKEIEEIEMERRKSSQKKRKGRSEKGNTDKPAKAVVSEQRLLRSSLNKDVLKGLDATDEDDDWWDSQLKNLKALKDPPPRKTITVEGKWLGKTSDGKTPTLEEDYVRKTFGDCFTDELKQSKRGWVDIPVGDFKQSRLNQHPELKVIGAPAIQFVQSEGKDLCVSKSLASAFFALGWHDDASKIDAFGEEILKGAVVDALRRVVKHARTLLPTWIVIQKLPSSFDWKVDLKEDEVVLGVLQASDDSCSHAVTIHGDFIYDANERIALRLCDEALDYCTSSETVQSKFVAFKLGFRFFYEGKRPLRRSKMRLPA